MNRFWIVISETRGASPYPHRHTAEQLAVDEAMRLTRSQGGVFYVLEAKFKAAKNDVVLTNLDSGEEMPF